MDTKYKTKRKEDNKVLSTVIPAEMVPLIERAMRKTGAVNISDFLRDAIRDYLKQLGLMKRGDGI